MTIKAVLQVLAISHGRL